MKTPRLGMSLRGFAKISHGILAPASGYATAVPNFIFEAHHNDLMPSNGGALFTGDGIQANNGNGLDSTVGAVQAWNAANPLQKQAFIVRVECGTNSADWMKKIGAGGPGGGAGWTDGQPFQTSGSAGGAKSGTMPVYFDPQACVAYQDFITKLGAYMDAVPEIRGCTPGLTMLQFGEVFWRFASVALNVNNFHTAMANTSHYGLTSIAMGSHTLTDIDFTVMKQMLDIHAAAHPNTPFILDTNPYDNVDPLGGSFASKLDFAQQIWQYWISTYPSLLPLGITNASFNLTSNGPLYAAMQGLGPLGTAQAFLSAQTYPAANLAASAGTSKTYRRGLYARAVAYGFSALELPDLADPPGDATNSTTDVPPSPPNPADSAYLYPFNTALIANGPSGSGPPPPSGIAQVGSTWSKSMSGTATSLTMNPHTVVDGDSILVSVGDRVSGGTTISGIVDDLSNAFSLVAGTQQTSGILDSELWRLDNVTGGSRTITITASTTSTLVAHASEWANLGVLDKVASATGSVPSVETATTAATTATAELVYAWVISAGQPTQGSQAFNPAGTAFFLGAPVGSEAIVQSTGAGNVQLQPSATLSGATHTMQYSATPAGTTTAFIVQVATFKASTASATAPSQVTGVTAIAGDTTIQANWSVPTNNGAAIDKYTATPYQGVSAGTPVDITGSPPSPSVTLTGLTDGLPYTVHVTAHNSAGTSSPDGVSAAVTPQAVVTPPPPSTGTPPPVIPAHPRISARFANVLKGLGE